MTGILQHGGNRPLRFVLRVWRESLELRNLLWVVLVFLASMPLYLVWQHVDPDSVPDPRDLITNAFITFWVTFTGSLVRAGILRSLHGGDRRGEGTLDRMRFPWRDVLILAILMGLIDVVFSVAGQRLMGAEDSIDVAAALVNALLACVRILMSLLFMIALAAAVLGSHPPESSIVLALELVSKNFSWVLSVMVLLGLGCVLLALPFVIVVADSEKSTQAMTSAEMSDWVEGIKWVFAVFGAVWVVISGLAIGKAYPLLCHALATEGK